MSRQNTKLVKEIIEKHFSGFVFNDVHKDKKTRRIKVMKNGFKYQEDEYKQWDDAIQQELKSSGVWYTDAGFKRGESWRGDYIYYSVVIEG
jgi:hypothetical protein